MSEKFYFKCKTCGNDISGFAEWFKNNQKCTKCGDSKIDTIYSTNKNKLRELVESPVRPSSLWHYFDFLPLNDQKNIISDGEGVSPIYRWEFLEKFAKDKYGLTLEVYVNRNDYSPATGTFKDKGATLAASVLKEQAIKEYVVVSTGNTANAFSQYLAKAGISTTVFMPQDALRENFVHIGSMGQKVYIVKGDYAYAKKVAADYAQKNNILITQGNLDPLRLEAKKTTTFEIIRQLKKMPDVYIQAVSGGTAPLAVQKAFSDFKDTNILGKMPRMLFAQGSYCDPQVIAWKKAKKNNFPPGWQKNYPIIENPVTLVPTIATGNPGLFPILGPLVKATGGDYFSIKEELAVDMGRLVAFEKAVKIGPASAIAILGYFEALKHNKINNDESIFINMGEGVRRALSFVEEMSYTIEEITNSEEAKRFDREKYRNFVWKPFC